MDGAAEGSPGPPPVRFRVTDLRRHPGGREQHHRSLRLPGLSVGDARVAERDVELDVVLETLPEGVRVDAVAEFEWVGECRRCLGEAHGAERVVIEELFVDDPEGLATEEVDPQPIREGWVDLGEVVRDSVMLGLPLAPLCRPDCPGPAPDDFPVAVQRDSDDEDERAPDPRWAVLDELRFDRPGD